MAILCLVKIVGVPGEREGSRQIERLMVMGGSEGRPKVSPFGNSVLCKAVN